MSYRVFAVGRKGVPMKMIREADDVQVVDGEEFNALRASIGGREDIGYYCTFRGDPAEIVDMLKLVSEAAADMLPRGNYQDKR